MDLLKLGILFLLILVLAAFKWPLIRIMGVSILALEVMFMLPIDTFLLTCVKALYSPTNLKVFGAMFFIMALDEAMNKRHATKNAVKALNGLFNNRRVNAMWMPAFMGLLPSPGGILLTAPLVDDVCEDYLKVEERAIVNSYFRHFAEMWLPTFTQILVAIQVVQIIDSSVTIGGFLLTMLPMVLALMLIGYFFFVRKLPKDTGAPPSIDKKADLLLLVKSLLPIVATIVLIVFVHLDVYVAAIIVLAIMFLLNHYNKEETIAILKNGLRVNTLGLIVVTMIFKDVLAATGVLQTLPEVLSGLPVPPYLLFAIIFLVISILTGSTATACYVCVPLAFAAIPTGGAALLMLLLVFAYAGNMVTPLHVCIALNVERYKVNMNKILMMSIAPYALLAATGLGYYLILQMFVK